MLLLLRRVHGVATVAVGLRLRLLLSGGCGGHGDGLLVYRGPVVVLLLLLLIVMMMMVVLVMVTLGSKGIELPQLVVTPVVPASSSSSQLLLLVQLLLLRVIIPLLLRLTRCG